MDERTFDRLDAGWKLIWGARATIKLWLFDAQRTRFTIRSITLSGHPSTARRFFRARLGSEVRERVHEVLHEIALAYDIVIEELEVSVDHVHVFCSFPPRLSISQVVTRFKSLSARTIFREHPQVKRQLWGGEFWEDGYFVRTVGDKVTAEVIKKYIQHHQQDRDSPQLKLF